MSSSQAHGGRRYATIFMSFMPELSGSEKRGVPRLSHKKSRTGCQRCRTRRVKCNEAHPVCSGCQRHGVPCVYRNLTVRPRIELESKHASKNTEKTTTDPGTKYPESEERRLLELRLWHHYMTKTAFSLPGSDEKPYRDAVLVVVPQVALKSRAWLYTIFAFSSIHIAKTTTSPTEEREFMDTFHKYFDLALQEHRRDIADLCKATADTVCMTSSLIQNCTQALVQDRQLHPYSPPFQWMRMMNGSGDVFRAAWDWIYQDESSLAQTLDTTRPNLSSLEELFNEMNGEVFSHILHRSPADEEHEPWDIETQLAYEWPLSYIGAIQIAVDRGEIVSHNFRRVIAFSMFAPKRYIELVEQGQPRALVVLAYYFAFLARLRDLWWIGDTGRREIQGIRSVLESPWVEMLDWPLKKMEEKCEVVGFSNYL